MNFFIQLQKYLLSKYYYTNSRPLINICQVTTIDTPAKSVVNYMYNYFGNNIYTCAR